MSGMDSQKDRPAGRCPPRTLPRPRVSAAPGGSGTPGVRRPSGVRAARTLVSARAAPTLAGLAEIERDHGQHMGEESSRELPNSVQRTSGAADGSWYGVG